MAGEEGDFDLKDLLKLAIDEEHWFLDAQHKREAFYSSIITAVIAATIAGALNIRRDCPVAANKPFFTKNTCRRKKVRFRNLFFLTVFIKTHVIHKHGTAVTGQNVGHSAFRIIIFFFHSLLFRHWIDMAYYI